MPKQVIAAEDAFQETLDGVFPDAPARLRKLVAVAKALEPARGTLTGPTPHFRSSLRDRLMVEAQMSDEEVFAAALERRTEATPELVPLVRVASALRSEDIALPSAAFRYRLRNDLMSRAQQPEGLIERVADRLAAINAGMRRTRKAVAAVGLAAMMMLTSGSALAAASTSLPVDPLYGVKRFREGTQLTFTRGAARGEKLLGFARVRLGEVRGLDERGVLEREPYVETLNDMDEQTLEGTELLIDEFRESKRPQLLRRVKAFAAAQAQDLGVLIPRLPAQVQPVARDSASTVDQVIRRVDNVLAGCPCPSDPMAPPPSSTPSGGEDVGCACDEPSSEAGDDDGTPREDTDNSDDNDGDTPPKPDPGEDGDGDQDGGDGDGDGDGDDDDNVIDLPADVPGEQDDAIEDAVNEILDDLATIPGVRPSPLPTSINLP